MRSAPKPNDVDILMIVHGGILKGGIRQGVFIKSMFSIALLYMGANQLISGAVDPGITNLFLGVSLGISSIASEIEAWELRNLLRGDD